MSPIVSRLLVAGISALPVIELRGGVPLGRSLGLAPWETFFWSVLGNMVPIVFILLWLKPVTAFLMRHSSALNRWLTHLFEKTQTKHSKTFERLGAIGLITFVAIPLPGTGAWTGALIAFLFGIPYWAALLLIFLGVLGAGLLMTAGVESVMQLVQFLF